MGTIANIAAKVEEFKLPEWAKKSVTVPVKLLVLGAVAVVILTLALSLAHKAQPRVDEFLWRKPVADVNAPVLAAIDELNERINVLAFKCKEAAAPQPVTKKAVK